MSPPGWTARTKVIEDYLKGYVSDEFVLERMQGDQPTSIITVQRVGPDGHQQWDDALKASGRLEDGYKPIKFQGQPAFARFLTGHGPSRAGIQPTLSQQLVLRSHGQWFILTFQMQNVYQGKPHYTKPLKVIDEYFQTFRYQPVNH